MNNVELGIYHDFTANERSPGSNNKVLLKLQIGPVHLQ